MSLQYDQTRSDLVVKSDDGRITIDLKPLMVKKEDSHVYSSVLIELGEFEIEIRPALKPRPRRSLSITHRLGYSDKSNQPEEKVNRSYSHWDYSASHGPFMWSRMFPQLQYKRFQSPIRIYTDQCKYEPTLERHPFIFEADENCCQTLENNGHSFQVSGTGYSYMTRGPVRDEYRFLQFHMHWGANDSEGSEHVINGVRRPAELHIVTWNTSKYKTAEEALASERFDGVLVFAVLFKVIPDDNPKLVNLFNLLAKIKYKGDKVNLDSNVVSLVDLMPENMQSYYTYAGSLTTPMCNECVRWVIFRDKIGLSRHQLIQLRRLKCVEKDENITDGYIAKNFRPVMPLNGRTVYRSFL